MIFPSPPRPVVPRAPLVALVIALIPGPACNKKDAGKNPDDHSNVRSSAPRPDPMATATVPPVPPGAPTQGDLLAFEQTPPTFLDWRKTPVWADLVQTHFRLDRSSTKDARRILSKGWGDPGAQNLLKHLQAQARVLDRAANLPPCAPLQKTWTHTELLLQHRSLFTLRALGEALLLRARHHQHLKRPGQALNAAVAALRLSCHMTHVPEVIMQFMALRAEQQVLHVLRSLGTAPAGCKAVQRALTSEGNRRAPLFHMARSDWLMARSHLRLITRDLTKSTTANPRTKKRLQSLMRLIMGRTSERYQRFSLLLRQALSTGLDSDWKNLDGFLVQLDAGLKALKKKHDAKSSFDLTRIVSQLPDKSAAWAADIISRVFLGLVTMRSAMWKRARLLYNENRRGLAKLRSNQCP